MIHIYMDVQIPEERPAYTTTTVGGIDAMTLPAITDLKEAWYGIEIDKKKYKIVLEDETEDSVYLKIVKKQPPRKGDHQGLGTGRLSPTAKPAGSIRMRRKRQQLTGEE